ncbi:hypothetical protein [Sulfuricurvum sp.]|uniref:hypothetical protein n=1 Tax=Sulfuricurvum sp. TaxID=2025608 RepID=UPI002E3088E4|nr:hypothetical protein [Sulfuricurvum sp.]HEX5329900.1 hypothetical protein [Sulfuricurvum sp.]
MRRFLLYFTLAANLLALESDLKLHAKMMDKLAVDLVNKERVKIYDPTYGRSYDSYLSQSDTVHECSDADIAIVSSINQIQGCKNQIILVTKYSLLNELSEAIGAFYWQKGRPNLVFIRSRLAEKKVRLNNEYAKHIDERIY